MAHGLRPKLNLLLAAEVKHRFPSVLESVSPAARHAVIGLAPAERVHESPAPLPPVRDDEIHHVQVAFPVVGVLFDVEEVGAIGRQNRFDSSRDRAEPRDVLIRTNRLEAARCVVLALRRVGRRGHDHVGQRIAEQNTNRSTVAAVAADQAVGSDQPHVAGLGYRLGWRFGDLVGHILRRCVAVFEQRLQFLVAEANEREVRAVCFEFAQFAGEHFLVPSGIHRELVVREDICPPLRLAEVVQYHHRNLREAQFASSQQTTVAGNDPIHRVNQDRIGEAELQDGRRDLRYLFGRVRARVPGVRHQPVGRPDFDAPCHRGRYGRRKCRHWFTNNYRRCVSMARKSNVGHSPWLAPEAATLSRPGAPCRAVWIGVGRLVHPPPRARPGRH